MAECSQEPCIKEWGVGGYSERVMLQAREDKGRTARGEGFPPVSTAGGCGRLDVYMCVCTYISPRILILTLKGGYYHRHFILEKTAKRSFNK